MDKIRSFFNEFWRYYPRILVSIIAFGDIAQTFVQTVIIGIGLPLILVGLLVVEHHGIYDGLKRFMSADASSMAFFGALVLVMLNLAIEFQIVHTENEASNDKRSKFKERPAYEWSWALLKREWEYRSGQEKNWKPRPKSPARRFYSMRRWLTVAIFILALSGRMTTAIQKVSVDGNKSVPLAEGITKLQTESSLSDVITWFSGTLFTMVALVSAQGLTHYIAVRVIEIKVDMQRKLTSQKAQATKERNRAAKVQIHDAYQVERVRNNALQPVRIGQKYQCPKCEKVMSSAGWTKHPCRFEIKVSDLTPEAVSQLSSKLVEVSPQLATNKTNRANHHETSVNHL